MQQVRDNNGLWLNTEVFREPALKFLEDGYYFAAPEGSQDWFDYWDEERRRCLEGYSVNGVKITGEHYNFLNYCPILKVEITDIERNLGKKVTSFPDFWDGDYEYFWIREIARNGLRMAAPDPEEFDNLDSVEKQRKTIELYHGLGLRAEIVEQHLTGGYDLVVGKARRRGYSYKAASICTNNITHRPNSYTLLIAYEKKFLYPKGLFSMVKNMISFRNENTGWRMPSDVIDRQDHIRNSYYEYVDGIKVEKGFMSEVQALSAKDNPDVSRGKDAYDVFFEESGAFGSPGLLIDLHKSTQEITTAGSIKTGMITVFGTSGNLESGTADFANMHDKPLAYNMLPCRNIWDEGAEETTCGFFHPITLNFEGYYDKQGNSDFEGAREYELEKRKAMVSRGASSTEIQMRMQERPIGPKEAFGAVSLNSFPVVELKARLAKVKTNNLQFTKGTPVNMFFADGRVNVEPILDGSAKPITSYVSLPQDLRGCPMIYEMPIDNPPRGLYKIGYDPIRQDEGSSLAAIVVYKGTHIGSMYNNCIVAEYIGRMADPEAHDRIAEMFAILYNTKIMFENEVTSVRNYFRRIRKLHLLAAQPDAVISKNIKNSKVARVYGCHMTTQLIDAGIRYINTWLLQEQNFNEFGEPLISIDYINSIRLLEELIYYNRKGNFDYISALVMAMFQVQEEELNYAYDEEQVPESVEKMNKFYDLISV